MEHSIRKWAAAWVGLTICAAARCVAANPELLALASAPATAPIIAKLYGDKPNVLLWAGPQGMRALVSGVCHPWPAPLAGALPAGVWDFVDTVCGADATVVRNGACLCATAAGLHRRAGGHA